MFLIVQSVTTKRVTEYAAESNIYKLEEGDGEVLLFTVIQDYKHKSLGYCGVSNVNKAINRIREKNGEEVFIFIISDVTYTPRKYGKKTLVIKGIEVIDEEHVKYYLEKDFKGETEGEQPEDEDEPKEIIEYENDIEVYCW